jgi:hypothetical protein
MLVDLHGLTLACESPDDEIRERWARSFASRPPVFKIPTDIVFSLRLSGSVPNRPTAEPVFTQGDLLSVYLADQQTTIHFSRFGQLRINLATHFVEGEIVRAALDSYGVFEDVLAMGLAPLLRRRGMFLVHAFAASRRHRALLLIGDIGSGKTTTGISLLRAGWKLLSNDSPLLKIDDPVHPVDSETPHAGPMLALAYPGLLSAYQDTLRRFPELEPLSRVEIASQASGPGSRKKVTFAAESIYPDVWAEAAPVGAIVFPHVAHAKEHHSMRLGEADALRRLLPNAIDRWDTALIPEHLYLLKTLAATTPAYQVELGESVETLATLLEGLLRPQAASK